MFMLYAKSAITGEKGYEHTIGFRPIFNLKKNILVEKILDANEFVGNGQFNRDGGR